MNQPNQIAIMYCPGHQKDSSQTSHGNQTANKASRQAVQGPPLLGALIPHLDFSEFIPHYTEQDEEQAHKWGFSKTGSNSKWKSNTHSMILLLKALVYPLHKHLHEGTHYGRDALMDLIRPQWKGPHSQRTIQKIT